jgi:hypothetical protein
VLLAIHWWIASILQGSSVWIVGQDYTCEIFEAIGNCSRRLRQKPNHAFQERATFLHLGRPERFHRVIRRVK